jgi:hypothetical protein
MRLILLFFITLLTSVTHAETVLQGGVVEKVKIDRARYAAFDQARSRVSLKAYSRIDQDLPLHLQARLRQQTLLPDRILTFFSDGGYSVSLFGSYEMLYYNSRGYLFAVEQNNLPQGSGGYPRRGLRYSYPSGKLILSRYDQSQNEVYAFKPNGSLDSYCLSGTCYRPDGSIERYRNTYIDQK